MNEMTGIVKLTYVGSEDDLAHRAFLRQWPDDPYALKRTAAITFLKSKGIWDNKHNAPHLRIR